MKLSVIPVYRSSSCTTFFFISSVLQYVQLKSFVSSHATCSRSFKTIATETGTCTSRNSYPDLTFHPTPSHTLPCRPHHLIHQPSPHKTHDNNPNPRPKPHTSAHPKKSPDSSHTDTAPYSYHAHTTDTGYPPSPYSPPPLPPPPPQPSTSKSHRHTLGTYTVPRASSHYERLHRYRYGGDR